MAYMVVISQPSSHAQAHGLACLPARLSTVITSYSCPLKDIRSHTFIIGARCEGTPQEREVHDRSISSQVWPIN